MQASVVADGSEQQADSKTSPLVSADWLATRLAKPSNLRVIDLTHTNEDYRAGHIPGAVFVDWRTEIIDGQLPNLYQLPTKQGFEALMSRLGVDAQTTVVLTDDMANRTAVRMYYTLRYFGHDRVKVLDGGTGIWRRSGRTVSKAVPKVAPTDYRVSAINEQILVDMKAMSQSVAEGQQILDSRPTDQYSGKKTGKVFHTLTEHRRRGHVPGAFSVPWKENLKPDGTFKPVDELRQLYQDHHIDTERACTTYCNEGLHAAMPWFVLQELLGNDKVMVYDNSMAEWANRMDTPMTIEAAAAGDDDKRTP